MHIQELRSHVIEILQKRYLPAQSSACALLEQAEQLIYGYLQSNGNDISAMFMLALIETFPPLADDPQAILILQH